MIEELEGLHLRIEGVWVLELLVPRLIHHRNDEGAAGMFGCFVQLAAVSSRFVFAFGANDF